MILYSKQVIIDNWIFLISPINNFSHNTLLFIHAYIIQMLLNQLNTKKDFASPRYLLSSKIITDMKYNFIYRERERSMYI